MEATLLRKLTEKSIMKFGQYADCSVQELINSYNTRYLRWVYFNCDMITFTGEILEKIRIPKEYHIKKPGKNPEYNIIVNEILDKKISFKKRMRNNKSQKISNLRKKINAERKIRKLTSRGYLARKNHGHNMGDY